MPYLQLRSALLALAIACTCLAAPTSREPKARAAGREHSEWQEP